MSRLSVDVLSVKDGDKLRIAHRIGVSDLPQKGVKVRLGAEELMVAKGKIVPPDGSRCRQSRNLWPHK